MSAPSSARRSSRASRWGASPIRRTSWRRCCSSLLPARASLRGRFCSSTVGSPQANEAPKRRANRHASAADRYGPSVDGTRDVSDTHTQDLLLALHHHSGRQEGAAFPRTRLTCLGGTGPGLIAGPDLQRGSPNSRSNRPWLSFLGELHHQQEEAL